jgi:signal peptidase I
MRWFFVLVLLFLALALAIFQPDLNDAFDRMGVSSDSMRSTPTTTPEPTPVTSINAAFDRDPREVLVDLIQEPGRPNLELIYRYLPERFQVLDFDDRWVGMLAPVNRAGSPVSVEDFAVEQYEGYVLVRSEHDWRENWVLVIEDDEWRLDPGDRYLLMASAWIQQGDNHGFSYGMTIPDDYQARSRSEPDDQSVVPFIRGRMQGVGVHQDGVDVVIVWEHEYGSSAQDAEPVDSHLLNDVVIPLEGISWRTEEESGSVEVRWSDAGVANNEIRLLGWPSEEMASEDAAGAEVYELDPYTVTLRLVGVPEHTTEITLGFGRIDVGPFGNDKPELVGQVISYTWEFVFPRVSTDPVLMGEPPEPAPTEEFVVQSTS